MRIRWRRAVRPACEILDQRCLLSGLTPQQVRVAYGLNDIRFLTRSGPVQGNGAGETIALIEAYHDPTIASDLHAFDVAFGLPDPSLTVVDQAGSASNPGWQLEESLDVEWAHAIAPAARIVVVEAASQTRVALLNAVNTARNMPGVVSVSMSWGTSEFHGEAIANVYFQTPPGHQGITFLAASGDSGAANGVDWPSASPYVVAVGGTSLVTDITGAYLFESTWPNSGGGYSRNQFEPSYQSAVQISGRRSTPDVAFDADPYTGVLVYQTSPFGEQDGWQVVGGTSLGTPAWAAIIAIVDQGRALQGKGSLDGPTQTLPALYSVPSSDFNAIQPLSTRAAKTSTGRGSPRGPQFVYDLVASTVSEPLVSNARARLELAAHAHIRRAKKILNSNAIRR
jgi:subtilase family serine protease